MIKINQKLKKIKKRSFSKLKKIANTKIKVRSLFGKLFRFTRFQVSIRPRLRLFFKVFLILVLLLAISAQGAQVLADRKEQIVVGGRKILVAEQNIQSQDNENNLDQKIEAVKSPFEFHMPVDGHISQGFSYYHNAIDIAADLGNPVHPLGKGVVKYAGYMSDGHGLTVVVEHENGLSSSYAHLGRIYVGTGNYLEDGQRPIGAVGLTGRTTGPHVHLEITDNGKFVDPFGLLP